MATADQWAAEIAADKKSAADGLRQEAAKKVLAEAKRNTLRIVLRWINFGAAATVVGLIITFLFMNTQLFWGNLVNAPLFKDIKLAWWEVVFIIFINLMIILGVAFAMVSGYTAYYIVTHPIQTILEFTKWIIKSGLCEYLGASC